MEKVILISMWEKCPPHVHGWWAFKVVQLPVKTSVLLPKTNIVLTL